MIQMFSITYSVLKKITGIAFLLFSLMASGQNDSCRLRISLLTCTPGEELYSSFGHSALRVFNYEDKTDLVYNYGTFDFYDPAFYQKFVKGKLLYFVSVDSTPSFTWEYEYFNRGVTEQVLHLSCSEKESILAFLQNNIKEENRYYRYDFNYDNCTTRLRDILESATADSLLIKNILPGRGATFRQLIHDYLDQGVQPWSKLGIDILLGMPLDKKITNREAMFLPDYLFMALDSASKKGQPLVVEKNVLVPASAIKSSTPLLSPLPLFGFLLLLILGLSFLKPGSLNNFFRVFDFTFFLLLGLLGCLLIFMWFGTEHAMCRNNLNLLWAIPVHLPVSFFLFKKRHWLKMYFRFIFILSILLLGCWFFLPQQFNTALLPVLGLIIARSYFISRNRA